MAELNAVHFESGILRIGTFYCPPWYTSFGDTGPIGGYLMVFPRTSVYITHDGRSPVVADPNVVMFYNHGQIYRRSKLSEEGDLCDWFSFLPQVVVDAIRPFDPAVQDHPYTPFVFTHGPSDPQSYLLQRLVIEHLQTETPANQLFVEETMLTLLHRLVSHVYQLKGKMKPPRETAVTRRHHQELVQVVKAVLATQFAEDLTVCHIAQEVYSSPYHLCRIFRQYTGQTIHSYLNQLRLRLSLNYVAQSDIPITDVGIALGYSSHSHFTQAFRQTFGTPPSHFRRKASTPYLQQLSNILIV